MSERINGHDLTRLPLFTGEAPPTMAGERPGRVRGTFRLTDRTIPTASPDGISPTLTPSVGLGAVPASQLPAGVWPVASGEVLDWSLVAAFRAQASDAFLR